MPNLDALMEAWNSPPTRHAMLVHLPIVLSMIAIVLTALAAMLRRNRTLLALAIACNALLAVAAYFTVQSGENAEGAMGMVSPEVDEIVEVHEERAEKVWMFGVGGVILLALSTIRRETVGVAVNWLAALLAIVAAGWVGLTAYHGGELVYGHGVGTGHVRTAATQPATSQPEPPTTRPANGSPPTTQPGSGEAQTTASVPETDPRIAFFREQVHPILSRQCFGCHNPRRAATGKSGSLDQTSIEGLLKGGRSGPAIVPGKPEESLLMHRMRGSDSEADIMPPRGKLPDETIAIIEQWIRDGAVWADPPASSE